MVEVLVEHDYDAKQPDELTIKKGDVITDVVKKQDGWCEGLLDGRRGFFPDNFVVVLHVKMRSNAATIRKCRVVYSYRQEHEDELNLTVGDVIDIVGEEEEGWWRGRLSGKLGVFPSNFVEEIGAGKATSANNHKGKEEVERDTEVVESTSSTDAQNAGQVLCEVKYAYQAQNVDELTLKEGDMVTLLNKDGQDAGWWRGELNGKIGVFPDNFVVLVTATETPAPTRNTNVAIQRKRASLEVKTKAEATSPNQQSASAPPAVPSKKPAVVAFKKSTSSASSAIFSSLSGITKKIADTIDGSTSSKSVKINTSLDADGKEQSVESYHAFDQVERSSLLQDVRANRVKAPGRRPPSGPIKEGDPAVPNGNSDYGSLEDAIESDAASEIKPKSIEFEKPPWLAEMKMNMKRSSTSPVPTSTQTESKSANKLEASVATLDDNKSMEMPPSDMSKSIPTVFPSRKPETRLSKTPPNDIIKEEKVVLRPKPIANSRPNSIDTNSPSKPMAKSPLQKSPVSPGLIGVKPPIADRSSMEMISTRHYNELNERLTQLEAVMHRQREEFRLAMEDLKGRLQVECDLRMMLQVELEKIHNNA